VCAQLENDVHRPHHYRDRATRSRVPVRRSRTNSLVDVAWLPPEGARVRLIEGLESRSAVLCEALRLLRACRLGASSTNAWTHGGNAATVMAGWVPPIPLHRFMRCSGLFRLGGPRVGESPPRLDWFVEFDRPYRDSW
jgi:hypothetical protein